jgi:hypothetical protein
MHLIGRASALLVLAVGAGCSGLADDSQSTDDALHTAKVPACVPTLECTAPQMPAYATRGWRHGIRTRAAKLEGSARHRGRDLFLNPGEPQTVIGKFAYGLGDKDLEDEEVDVFVQRDCGSAWEKLGTAITTDGDHAHATVEGVEDKGGRIYFEVPEDKALGLGRHRVRLVVAGDGTSADMFIDVVPAKTPIFVSDVDGTLTSSENVEYVKYLTGGLPDTHPSAPEALRDLAAKGYRPFYLTARPEWLTQRTRDFLDARGFPPGVVHTSTTFAGAGFGSSASSFKANELAMLSQKGLVPSYGFGNKQSDVDAYASIQPNDHRILYQLGGNIAGRRIDSFAELLPAFGALAPACK